MQMGWCASGRNTFGGKKPRGSAGSLSDPSRKDSGSLGALACWPPGQSGKGPAGFCRC